ncbi:MAG: hypothetical protein ABL958_03160 [Bdellovibrionia bacterium]
MKYLGFTIATLIAATTATAADFKWTGRYRFEGVTVRNSDLQNGGSSKAYMLHHLVLSPEIVAADGFNIYGRFDILNSANLLYANSQMGQFMGSGPGTATPTDTTNSNVLSQTQKADTLAISHLYLSWAQEFAELRVGRSPVHFGLGMTHNDGSGEFDHWMDTKDLVSYKMIFGNLSLTPMLGKVNEGTLSQEDDVNDYMLHFQYDNKDSKLSMGAFYEARIASSGAPTGNDVPTTYNGAGTITDGWEGKQLNIFVARTFDESAVGVEAGFLSGSTGLRSTSGANTALAGFGISGEYKWNPLDSKWNMHLKAGVASGDDPNTPDKFEGYLFDRNYDVATLLFNHVLGNYDLLRSSFGGKGATTGSSGVADVEALSNVMYISPAFNYRMADYWTIDTRLVYATLQQTNFGAINADSSLGFELDVGTTYRPHEHFVFGFDLAVLFPGSAFAGGSANFPKETAYGLSTKAAVSF